MDRDDDNAPRLKSGAKCGRPKGALNKKTVALKEAKELAQDAAALAGIKLSGRTPLQTLQFARQYFEDKFERGGDEADLLKATEIAGKEAPYSHAKLATKHIEDEQAKKQAEADIQAMSAEELHKRFGPKLGATLN